MSFNYIGADISKSTIDYFVSSKQTAHQIDNTTTSIISFLEDYDPKIDCFVVEPTGTYSDKFMQLCKERHFKIHLASPQKSHAFMKALGLIHKNDQNAAKALVKMAQSLDLPLYQVQSESMQQRKQIQMAYNALRKQKQQLSNQIHALEQHLKIMPQAKNALQTTLDTVEEQLKQLEKELQDLDDSQAKAFKALATSVTGIGEKNANLLLIYTNGLQLFKTSGALLSFVGIVPSSHRSGSSVFKRKGMTKKGVSQLRACLYNGAKSARRFNHACKAIYERLRKKGKPHKVAMVAVIKKLLQQVFAVVKSNTKFDNELYLMQLKKQTN